MLNKKKTFKERVYDVVWKIPKGKTMSYKEVAELAGSPRAWRAVGNIMNKHNLKGLPCHRVIKSDGGIGGFAKGRKVKKRLLFQEGAIKKQR